METGQMIKMLREQKGFSQEELALKVGYKDRSSIAKVEAGKVDLSQSKIAAFAAALGVTPAQLMGIRDTQSSVKQSAIPPGFEPLPKMMKVPLVGSIACGEPITAEENIEGLVGVPEMWHADFSLTCKGNSMEPTIKDGDVVAIRSQPEVENGQIAAVRINNEATLKKVYIYPDRMELRPINPECEMRVLYGEEMNVASIEGLAVGLCRGI